MRFDGRASREQKKRFRAERVARIVVTVDGIAFDGDETSQDRMARAIIALEAGETVPWICADNMERQVTADQLRRALRAAGEEQTRLWPIS